MIIGISGLAGSGKDTCADFLVRKYGFDKLSFADPMKRICRDVYGFTEEQLWGPSEMRNAPDKRYPRYHMWAVDGAGTRTCVCCGAMYLGDEELPVQAPCYLTPRFALQELGTGWGRHCYYDTWLEYALRVAQKLNDEGGYSYTSLHGLSHDWRPGVQNWKTSVVIPDVRFNNELDALKAKGAKLIRVIRPSAGLSGAAGQHKSETEQTSIPDSLFDAIIQNVGTLAELEAIVSHIVGRWRDPDAQK